MSKANGGTNNIENGQALCKPCHESKTMEENIERLTLEKTEKYLNIIYYINIITVV